MKPEGDREEHYRRLRSAGALMAVGLTLALSVGIGLGLGLLLDRWLGTRWLVIVGALVGIAAGFRQLILAVMRASREEDRAEREAREERRDDR